MTNLRKGITLAIAFVMTALLMTSCQEDEMANQVDNTVVSDQVIKQLTQLGFDPSDVYKEKFNNPLTGDQGFNYVVEGDILISKEQLDEMSNSEIFHTGKFAEQYRTSNLVSQNRTINVIGYTANNANGLDSKMRTALSWAIDNYNALNTGLTFTLTFGSNFSPFDMVVYRVNGSGGGSAGFPSGGNPNKFIQIQSGTSNFDTNVVEHVIGHEIGHSVGLRHTDWFNRSFSCGTGGSEGTAGVGAIHIPGTPTDIDPNSLMLACFSANEDGEFGQFDRVALEFLY
ncbi:M57 family metalloprotease [Marivirga arenosa]|uniref:M57 family metalloprotease n=1 Tax=Marivirga arenosa TaxID=3059076 RepID=A0AA51N945_9BACT|nr:M57 family metalloprotease [Marivirga sp. ABR2-2]WMN06781.1 M57 family metalloprotease [Marivirga sp. ABR2-2]